MNRLFALAALACLTACSSPAPTGNPPQLWIDLNGSELAIKLVPVEPPPF